MRAQHRRFCDRLLLFSALAGSLQALASILEDISWRIPLRKWIYRLLVK